MFRDELAAQLVSMGCLKSLATADIQGVVLVMENIRRGVLMHKINIFETINLYYTYIFNKLVFMTSLPTLIGQTMYVYNEVFVI